MSILKGALTTRRYRVVGTVPEDFRATFPELLAGRAFTEPVGLVRGEQRVGWVCAEETLGVDFSILDRWLFNQYAVLALRVERKLLPGPRLKAELARRLKAWCQEHGRERAPSSVRTEIRELLEDELYARVLPRTTTIEVVWNLVEGFVLIGSASDNACDVVRQHFRETFNGLALVETGPVDHLTDYLDVWDALSVTGRTPLENFEGAAAVDVDMEPPADLAEGTPREPPSADLLPHVAQEFLQWLWWVSEREEGRIDLGEAGGIVDLWVDQRVALAEPAEGRAKAVLTGGNPAGALEARAALAGGKVVRELALGLRRDGREYSATLKGHQLLLSGAKLPTECRGGQDEVVYERMYLYEDLYYVLRGLFRRFAAERTDARWWARSAAPRMQAWAHAAVAATPAGDGLDNALCHAAQQEAFVPATSAPPSGEVDVYAVEGEVAVLVGRATVQGDRMALRELRAPRASAVSAPASSRAAPPAPAPAKKAPPKKAPPAAARPSPEFVQLGEVVEQLQRRQQDPALDEETAGEVLVALGEAKRLLAVTRDTQQLNPEQARKVRGWVSALRRV